MKSETKTRICRLLIMLSLATIVAGALVFYTGIHADKPGTSTGATGTSTGATCVIIPKAEEMIKDEKMIKAGEVSITSVIYHSDGATATFKKGDTIICKPNVSITHLGDNEVRFTKHTPLTLERTTLQIK